MASSRRSSGGAPVGDESAQIFAGVCFHLSGFDRAEECEFIDAMERRGGRNASAYSAACSHVVVSHHTYDDPICAAARKDGKVLVTKDWVKDSLDFCTLMDPSSVLYIPVRDSSGIPDSKKFCICLTGYLGPVRREIEKMVHMMGAGFSKPLVAKKVTHLICFKFEGEKYMFAKDLGLKIVNHRWLEDCLKSWRLLDEKDYATSGWELEQAEAKGVEGSEVHALVAPAIALPDAAGAGDELKLADKEAETNDAIDHMVDDDAKTTDNGSAEEKHVLVVDGKTALREEKAVGIENEKVTTTDGDKGFDSEATTEHYDMEDGPPENFASTAKSAPSDCDDVHIVGGDVGVSTKEVFSVSEKNSGGEKIQSPLLDKDWPSVKKRKSLSDQPEQVSSDTVSKRPTISQRSSGAKSKTPGSARSSSVSKRSTSSSQQQRSSGVKSKSSRGATIAIPGNEARQDMDVVFENVNEVKDDGAAHQKQAEASQQVDFDATKGEAAGTTTIRKPSTCDVIEIDALEDSTVRSEPVKARTKQTGSGKARGRPIQIDIEDEDDGKLKRKKGRKASKSSHSHQILEKSGVDLYFALSGHSHEKKRYRGTIRNLHGHLCRDDHIWRSQMTHCVMSELRRTEKFFAALACGRWILKFEYLAAIEKAGRFIDEEEFEWFGSGTVDEGRIELQAPRKWRLSKQETGCGAFEGMRVVIYGECILPPLDTLKRAIKAGGGNVLATAPPYSHHLASGVDFAIIAFGIPHDNSHVAEILKHGVACVRDEYFVEFVCRPSASLQNHILFNTGAAAEKALEKLAKRKSIRAAKPSGAAAAAAPSSAAGKSSYENDDEVSEDDREDKACVVCQRRDKEDVMLLCDGCDRATHTFCCVPALVKVPDEDWYCGQCIAMKN